MIARVNIWNTFVGAVFWNAEKGYASFEYDPEFLKSNLNLSPLQLPLQQARDHKKIFSFPSLNPETFKGLPGLLADSLPDRFGNKLIDTWLSRHGRNPDSVNPVERLCYMGARGMGALEFEPSLRELDTSHSDLEIKELVRLAKEILTQKKNLRTNIRKKTDKALEDIISVGTSAGGARAKAIIAYNEITGEVRSGHLDDLSDFEYWIIKFDGVTNDLLGDPKGYGKIEFAYYKMATACGINMMESQLLHENIRSHFMTKRFDRIGNEKLHMQTLCALAHFDYNDVYSYSYEQAFQVMRELKLSYKDHEQLFLRMVFNVIARNQDDHTKNITFLMNRKGEWKLSPAYDVTFAFDPANKWMKSHQLSVNGKNDVVELKDLLTVAKEMNIKKPAAIIESVLKAVKNWKRYAKSAGVSESQTVSIGKSHLRF